MVQATTEAASASGSYVNGAAQSPLDREAFLKLLITQLRNQDPLNPMEDREFIAQLAQFSTLEQMQIMNSSLESSVQGQVALQSVSLIGRTVEALDPASGDTITGVVDKVYFESGQPILVVGDKEIQPRYVVAVS